MITSALALSLAVTMAAPMPDAASGPKEVVAIPADQMKTSIGKALPLVIKGAEGHRAKKACYACHNQGIALQALATARRRGFTVSDELVRDQLEHVARFLDGNRENYRKGKGQGGQVDMAASALLALEMGAWKPDPTTEAVAEYLLLRDKDREYWRPVSNRPPSEASSFTTTYLALRGLRHWGTPEQQARIKERTAAARGWLVKTPGKDTEDRSFRLWALHVAAADDKALRAAVDAIVRTQRDDGGWGQLDGAESDAYATGTALVALHEAGGMKPDAATYRRGVAYLVRTQLDDGSWLVRSRSRPFQTYFETGFPHGKNQFISASATAWAATALALAHGAEK